MAEKLLLDWQIPVRRFLKDFSVKRQDLKQRLILHQGITNTICQLCYSQLKSVQKFDVCDKQIMNHCHPDLRQFSLVPRNSIWAKSKVRNYFHAVKCLQYLSPPDFFTIFFQNDIGEWSWKVENICYCSTSFVTFVLNIKDLSVFNI